ncbi:hypothetical protein V8E36_007146 [Tilletia maclaganii]
MSVSLPSRSLLRHATAFSTLRCCHSLSASTGTFRRLAEDQRLITPRCPPLRAPFSTSTPSRLRAEADVVAELDAADEAYERRVQAAIDDLVAKGYDRRTIWRQTIVWGDHDTFQHGELQSKDSSPLPQVESDALSLSRQ